VVRNVFSCGINTQHLALTDGFPLVHLATGTGMGTGKRKKANV